MRGYVPQRQRCPSSACAISSSVGRGVRVEQRGRSHHHARRAEAALERLRVDERLLHRMQAAFAGQAFDGDRSPATVAAWVTQARTARRSTSTVQLPHWPSPHPYFVPVSWSCSRSTSSRLVPGDLALHARPFTVSVRLGIALLFPVRQRIIAAGEDAERLSLRPICVYGLEVRGGRASRAASAAVNR